MTIPYGPIQSSILIVGEAPGIEELRLGQPFAGASGQEFVRMLSEAGIVWTTCCVTNVCSIRPPNNSLDTYIARTRREITPLHQEVGGKWILPPLEKGIESLRQTIQTCQPNIIIALGNIPLWALTGQSGITEWRGSILPCTLVPGYKVLPTYHPAAILRQWGWRSTAVQDLRRAKRESASRELHQPSYSFLIQPSFASLAETLDTLQAKVEEGPLTLAVDIETRLYHIDCIGIAWSPTEALCIPFQGKTIRNHYWMEASQEVEIVQRLHRLLTHPNAHIVGQNFLFDAQYILQEWGWTPNFKRDTMIAHHVCFPGLGTKMSYDSAGEEMKEVKVGKTKSLSFLASLYCDHYSYWKGELQEAATTHDMRRKWRYNCLDCTYTWEVDKALQKVVQTMGMQGPHDFQQTMFWLLLRTMNRGVRIDTERLASLVVDLRRSQQETQAWLDSHIGHKVNFRSPKQVADLFYRELGQRRVINRTTGSPTTNNEALQTIAERNPAMRPLVDKIVELRSLGIFLSTFLGESKGKWNRGLLDPDGRIRCSYNPTGTVTFRLSSSTNAYGRGVNLQTIPKGNEA